MPISEFLDDPTAGISSSPIHEALSAGLDVLSGDQTVSFVPYVRLVLPLDGFLFWVNAALLPPSKLAENGLTSAEPITVSGSLHYASLGTMQPDENITIQKVDFAAQTPVTDFAAINSNVLYIAEWETPLGAFKFSFSQRSTYYTQADIHHYVGDAVYPVFVSLLVDKAEQFDQRQVVSNSMPLWLSLQQHIPFVSLVTSSLQLYPAYLIPGNLPAPYGVVEINSRSTRSLQAMPYRDINSSRWQLVTEIASVTLYGLRNDEALDFVDYVYDRSLALGEFGIVNMPVVRDEMRPQVELSALAMKKTVEFEVSYNQSRMRDIARQVISSALVVPVPASSPVAPRRSSLVAPFPVPEDPLKVFG